MGFVDRGGGREAKGTSLRRSKKNPGAPTTKNKSAHKNFITPTTRDTPTPPAACVPFIKSLAEAGAEAPAATSVVQQVLEQGTTKAQALHLDAAVALLSRKLEDDQEGIFRRAVEEGNLAGAVCWSNEVEKQAALLDTCVQHNKLLRGAAADASAANAPSSSSTAATTRHVRFHEDVLAPSPVAVTTGAPPPSAKTGVILYAVLGVHVNSVDRVNMRLHDQWIKELEENVKHGDVVGVLSGLNLSRDHGTHYAQERLLRECWRVAAAAGLPLVLHLYAAEAAALTDTVNRTAELISELLASATAATTATTESTKDGRGNNNSNNTNNNNAAATAAEAMPSAVVLYNGLTALHASPAMQQLVRTHRPSASTSVPFYVLVTAEGLVERHAGDEDVVDGRTGTSASVADVAALLPPRRIRNANATIATALTTGVVQLSQLLIGTGAPWGTPQNLPDAYLSTLPNEPGNYPYVVKTVFDAMPTGPPSEGDDSKDEAAVASAEELAAHVFLNQLRVFFHECIAAAEDEKEETVNTHNMNNNNNNDGVEGEEAREHDAATCEDDAARQRAWAQSQQPAAATAVAGLHDSAAKRDLEALLAEAAKERERVEQERQREEAERENARNEELLEKRSKREKKKHVKANNRSNFSHFRNKDFAPRQTKQERLAALQHQHELGAGSEDDDEENKEQEHHDGSSSDDDSDVEHGDAEASKERVAAGRAARGKGKNTRRDTSSGSSSSSSSDGDNDNDDGVNGEDDENNRHGGSSSNAANSLAAEVELLLKEAEEEKHGRAGQKSGKKNNKKNVKAAAAANATAAPPPPPPPSASATQKPLKGRKGKGPKAQLDSESSDKEENGSGQDEAAMAMNPASRRQRKRQQKRQQQQQHKGDDSDDE